MKTDSANLMSVTFKVDQSDFFNRQLGRHVPAGSADGARGNIRCTSPLSCLTELSPTAVRRKAKASFEPRKAFSAVFQCFPLLM